MPMIRYLLIGVSLIVALTVIALINGGSFQAQTYEPLYAQVTFGADPSNSIWFVAQGKDLYLDRDASDGVEPVEYVGDGKTILPFEFSTSDGKNVYWNVAVHLLLSPAVVTDQRLQELFIEVDVDGAVKFHQRGSSDMVGQMENVEPLHFDSELVMILDDQDHELIVGGAANDLSAGIGTSMAGERGLAMVCPTDPTDNVTPAFPEGVVPVVRVAFPPIDPTDKPIIEEFTLDESCWGSNFHGPVRAPSEAGTGVAIATVSFDAWKGRTVKPTTFEIRIVAPAASAASSGMSR